ncbi:hypothetical protein K2173_003635 [Erythroxylum novogranatense]|uniref:START domain-containing protein n=1 Tax=Erythroxylum novogranatense TaxID=1862640 RepID=A0AAV8TCC9_9ROSI|nr:hypothetical protein K2173_003635 [Erythroxylum novogranatense]
MALWSLPLEILRRPTIGSVFGEVLMFMTPLWIAVVVGIIVGWSWKPKWAYLGKHRIYSLVSDNCQLTLVTPTFSLVPSINFLNFLLPSSVSWIADDGVQDDPFPVLPSTITNCSSSQLEKEKSRLLATQDLETLYKLVEVKDGGPAWSQMMDRSTQTMGYRAWRRDPENGPPQYRSRTIFEDATPELVRDFFWDDEFRMKWDDMLIHAATLEECPTTGTMVVQWVRKFPFFCSDREYIIGRRIWESGRIYYCVTKLLAPLCQDKPRRVDLYYSSWCIRAVESKRGDGQLTACEVLLFHHEDMGIPWEIAKLGVRQGMWGAVKKIEPGLRAYQKQRASGAVVSRCAFMAQVNTKINADYLRALESNYGGSLVVEANDSSEKPIGRNIPKLLVVSSAILLACTLDRGLLTKAVLFGVVRRFAKVGRRL